MLDVTVCQYKTNVHDSGTRQWHAATKSRRMGPVWLPAAP